MNSKELRELFPDANLTEKRLRDWADNGLIEPPILGSFGYAGGVINEYTDSNIERIQLILEVNKGQKRVDIRKTQYALIQADYYLHGKNNREQSPLGVLCQDMLQRIADSCDISHVDDEGIFLKHPIRWLIVTAMLTPIGRPLISYELPSATKKDKPIVSNNRGLIDTTPLNQIAEFAYLFNIDALNNIIETAAPGELENAFYNCKPLFAAITPIAGTLLGYDYGKIPNIETFRDNLGISKSRLDKVAFEACARCWTTLFYMTVNRDESVNYTIENFMRRGGTVDEKYLIS